MGRRAPSYPLVAAGGSTRRQSARAQIEEMLELQRLEAERGLTPAESERMGLLIYREQQRAGYRPERIRRLRAELELLEALEIAQNGAAALPEDLGAVDLRQDGAGHWRAAEVRAA